MPSEDYWTVTTGGELRQGDWLTNCLVPVFPPEFGESGPVEVTTATVDLLIVTQSCDLANAKNLFVALCPIHTLDKFETANPGFAAKGNCATNSTNL